MEVYVTTFPTAGRRMRVSTAGGTLPQWRSDGAEVYFHSGQAVMSVAWQPAKDGQRFLVSVRVADAVPAPTTVVVNWPALLKQ